MAGPHAPLTGLSRSVDSGKINARYKNGVLEVTVPKAEEAKSREIQVDVK